MNGTSGSARGWLLIGSGFAGVAGLTVLLLAFLTNIFERKQEARQPFVRVLEVTEETMDPKLWAQNWPYEYGRAGGRAAVGRDADRKAQWRLDLVAAENFDGIPRAPGDGPDPRRGHRLRAPGPARGDARGPEALSPRLRSAPRVGI
jgi:hypothetical protein